MMGLTVQDWYALMDQMTLEEHRKMQKIGDPIVRAALREVAQYENVRFGQAKQMLLENDWPTVCHVLARIEASAPGRFDALAYCDGCRKFGLHAYDGPAVKLDAFGHWPTFMGVPKEQFVPPFPGPWTR